MLREALPMTPEPLQFSNEDFRFFQRFLDTACGIVLGDNKQYLVANRLRRIMEELNLSTLHELIVRIEGHQPAGLKERVIDAMTTNETFWFRDALPFDALKDVILPQLLLERQSRSLRIWSAACSSGQEPYSISMIIEEFRARHPGALVMNPEIVATDISTAVLDNARIAEYDGLSVSRGLSDGRRMMFFDPLDGGRFRLKREISQRVRFQRLNLKDNYGAMGQFDIIFCRNVLIYFAAELKCDILKRMHATLKEGGYLILGASESLPAALATHYKLERINTHTSVYRRQSLPPNGN
ncbi:chemotaxis protein CheR [Pseudohongiella nitratireducens]|uniref:protein-glutamate O-methyltransferase n=2 Tax=Pseudohongiella nitratireducens TaxID=1768907 RepID=A0A917GVD2_9GAMM|nr:chemotaxis protein CheR [Pseudohongiella nitratireducens]